MKKRILPVPLILLIPIVLLIIVAVAGIYRFSLTDEEILAKFPNQVSQSDRVMQSLFSIKTVNPWTIKIPESSAFTFIDDMEQAQIVKGTYEDGAERGEVSIDTRFITQVNETTYVSPLVVSNQGSGVFHYLIVSKYDKFRQRMVTKGSAFLGDRVRIQDISAIENQVTVKLLQRDEHQAMSEEPSQLTTILFKVTEQDSLAKQ